MFRFPSSAPGSFKATCSTSPRRNKLIINKRLGAVVSLPTKPDKHTESSSRIQGSRAMHVTVIQPVSTSGIRSEGETKSLCRSGVTVSSASLNSGPPSIESRVDHAFAVPGMVAVAEKAEQDGANALVIDCMGDPGLGVLRETVNIPVVGVAQTSMTICASLGEKFGIVSVLNSVVPMFSELVVQYGYERRYVGCRVVDIPVLDIHNRIDDVQAKLATHALQLVRDGADAIILGCTGFMGCAEAIRNKLHAEGFDVPVLDPIPTAVSFAAALVQNGLSHSKTTFPKLSAKPIKGYSETRQ